MKENLDTIKEKLSNIFKKQFNLKEIDLEKNYFDGEMANSIDALELLVKIEEGFKIEIEDEDLSAELISSVNKVSEYIYKKINN